MIFTALAAVLPIGASAAYSPSSSSSTSGVPSGTEEANLNSEELAAYLEEYLEYNFETAGEMLDYELKCGYLYYANSYSNKYTMYVNKYTGFVYYVNNATGQILTSNPIDPGYLNTKSDTPSVAVEASERQKLMSQIVIKFFESANSTNTYEYNSYEWAASRSQLSVSAISGGFRVSYTLGDTTARFLLPGMATADDFESTVLVPMIKYYAELLEEYCREANPDKNFSFFDNSDYNAYENGYINTSNTTKNPGLKYYLTATGKIYAASLKSSSAEYKQLDTLKADILKIVGAYSLKNPSAYDASNDRQKETLEKMYKDYPVTKDGTAIYVYAGTSLTESKSSYSNIIKKYCVDYTFSIMLEQEKKCGYVDDSKQKPVFRCALEYTFNEDGSLSVALPASSITFDEAVYTLEYITPNQYFGAGSMTEDGYIFYPDGSGTIIAFDDFYNEAADKKISIYLTSKIYGEDYCYSQIVGAHREQITMPVYGLVNEVKSNPVTEALYGKKTVTNGYFAILEEGSALANLDVDTGGTVHKYATTYASYTPYPSDEYDLSETISVGSLGKYSIVSESKYTGSYVTRFVMLCDDEIGETVYGKDAYYKSDYVGMAAYYRNYLKELGVLSALENVSDDLPLYVEVLGAMDITDKFLTFPITKSIPLTTFANVAEMYEELSKCEEYVIRKIAEYKQMAVSATDESQRYQYEKQAERYTALIGEIENIVNINFKLTGFVNGGMDSTYPVKVKWAKACGGKSGFKSLVKTAASVSANGDAKFSVYPDFDFMYIAKTAMFDGISKDGNASKMVDNRYASKQIYNAVTQEYESFFTLVVNPESLDKLYSKFNKKYSKYGFTNISVSTLGSDLNSNFDKDAPVNREDAKQLVENLLDRMANTNGYDVMVDTGNIYTVQYASHILNATIDSSHFRYSSYTIPFVGLVLHSYVNYTGTPLNYSGSPAYDILRSIESGASLYYILCYQNTSYMKDDEDLSKYYGVDYQNWYDSILLNYKELNSQIGDLQDFEIVDHTTLIAEREIETSEKLENYRLLKDELIELIDDQLLLAVDSALASLRGDSSNYAKRIKVDVTDENRAALLNKAADILGISLDSLTSASEGESASFAARLDAVIAKYEAEYVGAETAENTVTVNFSDFEYSSRYSYLTDSCAQDKDYVYTDYTIDNGNVTMVTYKKGSTEVRFVLNYNNYPVTVRLGANEVYELSAYGYQRINQGGQS